MGMCLLIRDFHQVLFPSCVAEGAREGLKVCHYCGWSHLLLATSSPAPLARRYGQKEVLDQFEGGTAVPPTAHNLCATCMECSECDTSRNRKA